jgi:VanZ family protein
MNRHWPKIRLTLFALAALGILWGSLDPHPYLPTSGFFSWDKVQHALAYAVLTLLGGWALLPIVKNALGAWSWAAAISLVYGLLMEMAQALLTRHRRAQFGDALADALGALAVFILAWLLMVATDKWKTRKRS